MDRVVLDTSVIVKSIFKPRRSLPDEIHRRELNTHEKCRAIINLLDERYGSVYVPKVCAIETAAVTKRLSNDKKLAIKISEGVLDSYETVDESILFDVAWTVAVDTGCTGFDSYFIALAKIKSAVLLTDDGGMHFRATEADVDAILVRDSDLEKIEDHLEATP